MLCAHSRGCQQLRVLHSDTKRLDSVPQREELVAHDVHARDKGQQEVPEEVQEPVSIMARL